MGTQINRRRGAPRLTVDLAWGPRCILLAARIVTYRLISAMEGNTFGEVKNSWSYGVVVVTCRSFVGLLVVS